MNEITINITGDNIEVTKLFLKVFLIKKALSKKELEVLTLLVTLYTKVTNDGVKEPYSSMLTFSAESRGLIMQNLGVSSSHLTNILTALTKKQDIINKDGSKYTINPSLKVPKSLKFMFDVGSK